MTSVDAHPDARLGRAYTALDGLAVGDAFGERFFTAASPYAAAQSRALPPAPWRYTDDTHMALSVVAVLRRFCEVNEDALARSFAERYKEEPLRGYGPGMHRLLPRIFAGDDWRSAARALFGGQGSFGNGAAMRVAPLGAYFADDVTLAAEQARRSAHLTHAHPEGVAGAVAVAVASAWAARLGGAPPPMRAEFIALVLPHVPEGETRAVIERARDLPPGTDVYRAMSVLGSGGKISAQDTVPFVLWCAGERLASYEEALWLTIQGLGDIDTNCAMVGGIVAAYTGPEGIPPAWRTAREPLPRWAFEG